MLEAAALLAGQLDHGVVLGGQVLGAASNLDVLLVLDVVTRGQGPGARLLQTEQLGRGGDGERLGPHLGAGPWRLLTLLLRHPEHLGGGVGWQLVIEDELAVLDEVFSDHGLDPDTLKSRHAPDLQGLAAEEVWRPHDGNVLGCHTGVIVLQGDSM